MSQIGFKQLRKGYVIFDQNKGFFVGSTGGYIIFSEDFIFKDITIFYAFSGEKEANDFVSSYLKSLSNTVSVLGVDLPPKRNNVSLFELIKQGYTKETHQAFSSLLISKTIH